LAGKREAGFVMKKNSLKTEIAEYYRRKINTGVLRPDDPIPSTCEIAEEFGTAPSNVHRALLALVREGLILRKPGHGSVVAPNLRKLRNVAVGVSVRNPYDGHRFRLPLAGFICDELKKRGLNPVLHFYREKDQMLEHLNRLTEAGLVQGAILVIDTETVHEVRDKLTIPYSLYCNAEVDYSVRFDPRDALDKAIAALKKSGARNLALIGTDPSKKWQKTVSEAQSKRFVPFHGLVLKTAKKYGLDLPEKFMKINENPKQMEAGRSHFGWCMAKMLFSGRKHPDALLVRSDDLIPGIIYALKEKNVRVPEDLRLIALLSRELPFFSPYPLVRIEFSMLQTASELCNILERASRGEKIPCQKIPYRFCGLPEEDFSCKASDDKKYRNSTSKERMTK